MSKALDAAIQAARQADFNRDGEYLPDDCYVTIIRAAIEAMRDPTDAMCKAGAATPGMSAVDGCITIASLHGRRLGDEYRSPNSPIQQAWRAMIDAALTPDEPA